MELKDEEALAALLEQINEKNLYDHDRNFNHCSGSSVGDNCISDKKGK